MKHYLLLLLFFCSFAGAGAQTASGRDYYLVKVYHCSSLQQIQQVEAYVGKEMIPFLHRNGVAKVGVFLPIDNDTATDKQLYLWIPLNRLDQLARIENRFGNINPYADTGLLETPVSNGTAPYNRIETSLSEAFAFHKRYHIAADFTPSPETVYEFRSYESSTENLHLRKVHMFNQGGEIALFKKLGFNAVFYARVIAGAQMPNLIYMTRFRNRADREEHWKRFGNSPEWKTMSAMPKYVNTVSKHVVVLMRASVCSEF
ncbi:MAG TPA: NIPSNAP family protein [Sediminibacterium sp.]|nr:NIPSNAP family protein [Sediminibacterium sp.]